MKNLHFAFVALAALVGVACDDNSSAPESIEAPAIPASDVDYIDNLVPHHQQALEMSEMAIARATRPDVRAMAEEMKAAQQKEIAEMLQIRAEVGATAKAATLDDPHADRDMAELKTAQGAEVDVVFLESMIPHHAGAVSLSHRALPNLTNAKLREMADMTIVMQTREMNEMLDMLGR